MLRKLLKNLYSTVDVVLFLKDTNYLRGSKYAIASIVVFTPSTLPVLAEEIKIKGWAPALKVANMATRFNEKTTKKNYLEEKFFSGQEMAKNSKQLL